MKVCVTIFELKFLCILTKNWVENILFAKFALHLPDISVPIVNEFTIKTLMLYIESQLKMSTDNFKLINHKMGISFLFSFAFHFPFFTAICKASSDIHLAFLHFFFLGMVWSLPLVQCHEPSSIVLQALYQI